MVGMEPIISLRQPWASAVFVAGKDVENRSWWTEYRGRLWIHASLRPSPTPNGTLRVALECLPRGVILGSVELIDIVENARSRWSVDGSFHWLLGSPCPLATPIPHRGRPGLSWFDPPR